MGADLNVSDYDGRTAIHLAVSEGKEELVRWLIDSGIKLTPTDRFGGTPLDDAKREGHVNI